MSDSRIIVGFSGGVSSAYCAGWALRNFEKGQVVFLFHDTKEEDPDTYRFITEMAAALNHPVTERSDGRSVVEVFDDENAIANNRMAFCSRILKAEQRDRYFAELTTTETACAACGRSKARHLSPARIALAESRGHVIDRDECRQFRLPIVNVLGFSAIEWKRVQRAAMRGEQAGYTVRFPMVEDKITKQQAADWCISLGVRPPQMYTWSEHANCVGCVRGGKAYWLAVAKNAPEVFEARAKLEERFGHTVLKDMTLRRLVQIGLKRPVKPRESIDIGSCECGD